MIAFLKAHVTRKRLVAAFVSAALMFLAVRRVDAAAMRASLDHLEFGWILAGAIVFGAACLFGAARWHCMLALNRCADTPWITFRATLSGHLCNTFLFGPAGGDILKATLYSRWRRYPLASVLASCWMDRLLAAMGSALFAVILVILARKQAFAVLSDKLRFSTERGLFLLCVAILIIVVVSIWKFKRPESILSKALGSLQKGFLALKNSPATGLAGVLLGMAVQVCLSSVLAFNLRACSQVVIPWSELFWVFPIVSLLTALPLTVAGIGVREGASIVLLGLFGIPASAALTASFLTLTVNFLWAFIGGLAWWFEENAHKKRG